MGQDYQDAVERYNRKIERLRQELETVSEETLEEFEEFPEMEFDSPGFEEYIFEITQELANYQDIANTEDFEVSSDLSRALYILDQIRHAAEEELERRSEE